MSQYRQLAEAESKLEDALVNYVMTRIRYTRYPRNLSSASDRIRIPKRIRVRIQQKLDEMSRLH